MTDKKTIGISSLIALGIVLAGMITPSFFDSPVYYCESRAELGVVQCDSFSKYVADNGKCIRDGNTNLICREGWVEVTNDLVMEEKGIIQSGNSGMKEVCTPDGCEVI